MAYATVAEFEAQWGSLAVKWSQQDYPAAAVANSTLIQAELDRATETMNGYLRIRYSSLLPFATAPEDLRWRCLIIAAYYLSRYPEEWLIQKYTGVISWLKDLAAGRASLGVDSNNQLINESDSGLPDYWQTDTPIFTEGSVSGY